MKKPLPENAQWSIDELAEMANRALAETKEASDEPSADNRMAESLTARNLRRLVSQGAIDDPVRSGREAYYGPTHLDQALKARALMSKGFTTGAIQTLRAASSSNSAAAPASGAAPAQAMFVSTVSADLAGSSVASQDLTGAAATWAAVASSHALSAEPEAGGASFFDARSLEASSFSAPSQGLNSTAGAVDFLDKLSASAPSPSPWGLQGVASGRLASLTASADLGSGFDKAYDSLARTKAASKPKAAAARETFECEPFPGLRLSIDAEQAGEPLDEGRRQAALAALEQAWEAARLSNVRKRPQGRS